MSLSRPVSPVNKKRRIDWEDGDYCPLDSNPTMTDASSPTAPVFNIAAGKQVELAGKTLPQSVDVEHPVPEELKHFETLRVQGADFDANIIVGDKKLPGHKAILSARVPFFRGVFDSKWAESEKGEITMDAQFSLPIVSSLVDYVYTGRVSISEANVFDAMIAANFLGIEPVMDECARFMRRRMRVDNALPLLLLCRSIGYHKMDEIMGRFIDKNLVSISGTPDFLSLSSDELEPFLRRGSLYVDEERQVINVISRWMEGDAQREKHAVKLLRCVRCTRLPSAAVIDKIVRETSWLRRSEECRQLMDEAKTALSSPLLRRSLSSFDSAERRCEEAHALVFLIGQPNNTNKPTDAKICFYDPMTDKWTECSGAPNHCGRNGVVVVDKKIYAIGGFDGRDRVKSCECYDALRDEWSEMPDLKAERSAMATGAIDGKIYVAGGFNGTFSMETVERMDTREKKPVWMNVQSMEKRRSAPASCVFNGKLYVFGGHDGQKILSDGECYNPDTNSWTPVAPMKHKRCRFSAAVYNGHIYVVGGFDGAAFLKEVERYDPITNKWTSMKPIKERRSRSTLAVSCGKLYVFGGFNGLINLSTVEMYVPEKDQWVKRASMPAHSGGISIGVLPIPATFPSPVAHLEAEDVEE